MKLEQQVCSLDLAKRLKELGVKQESLLGWFLLQMPNQEPELKLGDHWRNWQKYGETYSAFTVAELGEMLPKELTFDGFAYPLGTNEKRFDNEAWCVEYRNDYGKFGNLLTKPRREFSWPRLSANVRANEVHRALFTGS